MFCSFLKISTISESPLFVVVLIFLMLIAFHNISSITQDYDCSPTLSRAHFLSLSGRYIYNDNNSINYTTRTSSHHSSIIIPIIHYYQSACTFYSDRQTVSHSLPIAHYYMVQQRRRVLLHRSLHLIRLFSSSPLIIIQITVTILSSH